MNKDRFFVVAFRPTSCRWDRWWDRGWQLVPHLLFERESDANVFIQSLGDWMKEDGMFVIGRWEYMVFGTDANGFKAVPPNENSPWCVGACAKLIEPKHNAMLHLARNLVEAL